MLTRHAPLTLHLVAWPAPRSPNGLSPAGPIPRQREMGRAFVATHLGSCLLECLGHNELFAFLRYRRVSNVRRIPIRELVSALEPSRSRACRGPDVDARRRVESHFRPLPHRRNRIHVRSPISALGQATFAVPCRDADSAAVGRATERIRPARATFTISDCSSRLHRLAFHGSRAEYELRVHRSFLSSAMGTRSSAPVGDLRVYGGRRLPAN